MKNTLLLGLSLLLVPGIGVQAAPMRYSQDWFPVSGPEVQKRVKVAAGRENATELYSLRQQARTQGQSWFYALALRGVVQQQPRNAAAVATYSLMLLELMREASHSKNFARAKQLYFGNDLTWLGVRARIEQAKKVDSNQWPIWVAESQIIPFQGPDMELDKIGAQSEAFARRAVAIENNSFTNSALAYALTSRASWDYNPLIVNRAIIAATRASQMQPVSVQAKAFLLGLYRDDKKDPVKTQQVRKQILATIPPNVRLSDASKAYLRQLGIS